MWSSNYKSNVLIMVALLLAGLLESEASVSDSVLTHPAFRRGFFRTQDIGKVLRLGDSSDESEESNFREGHTNIMTSTRFSFPTRSRRVIRLGPSCEAASQRFDPITQTCYDVGTRGPCGPLMIFTGNDNHYQKMKEYFLNPEENKIYGHCECDRAGYDRPIVSIRGQCHFLYSQAICDPGHFLVMGYTKYGLEPVCHFNPCGQGQNPEKKGVELVPFEGQCVKLNAPSLLCPHSQDVVSFRKEALEPVCTPKRATTNRRLFRRQITRTNELKCQEGYGRLKAGSKRCYRLLKMSKR